MAAAEEIVFVGTACRRWPPEKKALPGASLPTIAVHFPQ
jgi:hypothetical protein